MATSGIVSGTDLRLYVGGLSIGYATTCTASFSMEVINTIHKDSPGSGWQTNTGGQKSGTVSFEGFVNEDSSGKKPIDLFTLLDDKTEVGCAFKTGTSGDTRLDFSALVTSVEITAPVEENSTFSGTLTVTGAVTNTTVT